MKKYALLLQLRTFLLGRWCGGILTWVAHTFQWREGLVLLNTFISDLDKGTESTVHPQQEY